MRLNKLYFGLIAAVLTFAFASCSEDDNYTWASMESGAQVYFNKDLPSTIDLSMDESSFTVTLNRVDSTESLTVPIAVTQEDGSIFTIPTSATFAAGAKTTDLTISYNSADLQYGVYEEITLLINDEANTTVYGPSSYTFDAGATEWEDYGTALYREDCLTTFYGVENIIYSVPIQRSVVTDGVYRIVNPYGEPYSEENGGYNVDGDWDADNDYYMEIDASDPDYVYIVGGETGMDWGYGNVIITSLVDYYLSSGATLDEVKASYPDIFGTLSNGVITMPVNSMLICMPDYSSSYYYANINGLFAVALPGYSIGDYSLSFTTTGTFVDTSKNEYVCGTFTFGEDLASVKYALTTDANEVENVYNGIIDGSVESETISASGDVQLPVDATGSYYLVAVGYNSSSEAVTSLYQEIKFTSTKDNAETWTALYAGVYNYSVADLLGYGFWYEGTDDAVLYVSDSDETRYKIQPWGYSDEGLIFTLAEDNTVTVDYVSTGESYDGYGEIYVSDCNTLFESEELPSYYDPSTGVITFYMAYHNGEYYFTVTQETFTISGAASAAQKKAASVKGKRSKANNSLKSHLVKTVNVKPWVKKASLK
ncbi:MAG: hypothetical protein Q4D41_08335 [Prevotellaceae bacterium]|nr:hypothetical protein [Prevotellaceae bacterium]